MSVNSYCVVVLSRCISSWTSVSTWKILLVNGKSKYKCFLEQIWNNGLYVEPCFVTLVGPNAKWSNVKPYA
jgi:hypothetical protein